jgi:hypothetical protein
MALHGSASANLSSILFKGNNRSLGVNVIIHQDQSGSMVDAIQFYSNGTFVGALQNALLAEKIGDDIVKYPNLYAYFDLYGRNPSSSFTISNPNGSLVINQSFIRGESTGTTTISRWISTNYISNKNSHLVNICTDVIGTTTGGRLVSQYVDQNSEDVHGNLWSIFTSPNSISSGISGRYGGVIGSQIRKGSTTIIITNSDEQSDAPADMINNAVTVSGGQSRTINGSTGEMVVRGYRVIALSSYNSTDGYDGVLFYGKTSAQPYGYVSFTSNTTYVIIRSSVAPNWTKGKSSFDNVSAQTHDTLTIANETRGGLFKIRNIFSSTGNDRRVAFSNCLAKFIADTV